MVKFQFTKEIGKMIKQMVMENIHPKKSNMKETGKTIYTGIFYIEYKLL